MFVKLSGYRCSADILGASRCRSECKHNRRWMKHCGLSHKYSFPNWQTSDLMAMVMVLGKGYANVLFSASVSLNRSNSVGPAYQHSCTDRSHRNRSSFRATLHWAETLPMIQRASLTSLSVGSIHRERSPTASGIRT